MAIFVLHGLVVHTVGVLGFIFALILLAGGSYFIAIPAIAALLLSYFYSYKFLRGRFLKGF